MAVLKIMNVIVTSGLWFVIACGSKTEVIDRRKDVLSGDLGPQNSSELKRRTPEEEEFLVKIDTPAVAECRDSGMVFDRRNAVCSKDYKIADFPCDRFGIQQKFIDTGFQIVAVLDQALGKPDDAKDRGDKFLIDQCGIDGTGRILIILVKPTSDGRISIREIQ